MSDISDAQGQEDQGQPEQQQQQEDQQGAPFGASDGIPDAADGFTDAQKAKVEAIVKQRLASERKKYADYADLKAKASKLDEMEAANLSELEKVTKARDDALAQAAEAKQMMQQTLVRSAVVTEATKQGAVDPDAVLALLSTAELELSEDGTVPGASDAVKKLLADKPYLKAGRVTGDIDGGARSNGIDANALGSMSMEEYLKATGRAEAFRRL